MNLLLEFLAYATTGVDAYGSLVYGLAAVAAGSIAAAVVAWAAER